MRETLRKGRARRRALRKWVPLALLGLVLALFGVASWLMGGPRGAYGFVRYAAPKMRAGALKPGEPAPDATLHALDGRARFHLREAFGGKPLVLIFGSYT